MRYFKAIFRLNDRGNISIFFALSLFAIAMAVGVAFDFNAQISQKNEAQDRVDAAVLAAAIDLNLQAMQSNSRKQSISSTKWVSEHVTPFFNGSSSIICGNLILTSQDVSLRCQGTIQSAFGGLTRRDRLSFTVDSTVKLAQKKNVEIALVLDISDSMQASGSLRTLELALQDFINQPIFDANTDKAALSIIPYANSVAFKPDMAKLVSPIFGYSLTPTFNGCFMPDTGDITIPITGAAIHTAAPPRVSNKGNPFCPSQTMAAEFFVTDTRSLRLKLSNISSANGTASDEALAWGYRALLPSMQGIMSKSRTFPRPYNSDNKKIIIFFTDGKPVHKQWVGKIKTDSAKSEQKLLDTCNFIKSSGNDIDLYTIGYGTLARNGTDLAKLLGQCVNGQGYFVNANKANLSQVLLGLIPPVQDMAITH